MSRARLRIDLDALARNYRFLAMRGGAPAGAAVKANAYGVGLAQVVPTLLRAGCRDFFVATVAEAATVRAITGPDSPIHVLGGILADELPVVLETQAIPVLNSAAEVALWRTAGGGAPCDLMIDTGMNRLGIRPHELMVTSLEGLAIDLALSHFACADEPGHAMTRQQLHDFLAATTGLTMARRSIANSAGILDGGPHGLDLTRPGLALYGGVPHPLWRDLIAPVVHLQARVLQRTDLAAGDTVGYNATWRARVATPVATIALGYGDGYPRALSNRGYVAIEGLACPILGRVSMDAITVDLTRPVALGYDVLPGDWIDIWGDRLGLAEIAAVGGISQYEMLTSMGARLDRDYESLS